MNYLEKIIYDGEVEKIEELLAHPESLTKLITPQKNGKTALQIALEYNQYDIVNLFGRMGVLELTKFNCSQFVLTDDKMSESVKLKYLQLFYAYDIALGSTFNIKNPRNPALSTYYSSLSYCLEFDYLHIFNFLVKAKVSHSLGGKTSLLAISFSKASNLIARAILDKKTPLKKNINANDLVGTEKEPLFHYFLNYFSSSRDLEADNFDNNTLIRKIDLLMEFNYDINLIDKNQETIAHVLVRQLFLQDNIKSKYASQEIIELLKHVIKNTPINLKAKNNKGFTAEGLANKFDFNDKFKQRIILSLF